MSGGYNRFCRYKGFAALIVQPVSVWFDPYVSEVAVYFEVSSRDFLFSMTLEGLS